VQRGSASPTRAHAPADGPIGGDANTRAGTRVEMAPFRRWVDAAVLETEDGDGTKRSRICGVDDLVHAEAGCVLGRVDSILGTKHDAPGTRMLVADVWTASSDAVLLVVPEPVGKSNVSQAAPRYAIIMVIGWRGRPFGFLSRAHKDGESRNVFEPTRCPKLKRKP
jgi:hypothetical protein